MTHKPRSVLAVLLLDALYYVQSQSSANGRSGAHTLTLQASSPFQLNPQLRTQGQFLNPMQMALGQQAFMSQPAFQAMASSQAFNQAIAPQQRQGFPMQTQSSQSPNSHFAMLDAHLTARPSPGAKQGMKNNDFGMAQMQAAAANQQAFIMAANAQAMLQARAAMAAARQQQMMMGFPGMEGSASHQAPLTAVAPKATSYDPRATARNAAYPVPVLPNNQYEIPKVVVTYSKPLRAVAIVTGPYGVSGLFNLSQSAIDQPVEVFGRLSGVRPGEHGIHIHALGDMSQGCDSVGKHFNPEGTVHGTPEEPHNAPHAGDMGNLIADQYGQSEFFLTTPLISLYPSSSVFVIGRALVIHDKPDDLGRGGDQMSRESGNSGPRIACGVIGFAN